MVSQKEAIDAVKKVVQFCKEQHMNCWDCPFGSDCLFKNCPSNWKLGRIKHIHTKEGL